MLLLVATPKKMEDTVNNEYVYLYKFIIINLWWTLSVSHYVFYVGCKKRRDSYTYSYSCTDFP